MPDADQTDQDASPRARLRLGIGAAVTVGLIVLSAAVGWGILRGQATAVDIVSLESNSGDGAVHEMSINDSGGLYVHVLGEVTNPGLYILKADARLVDALAAAGGTLDTADLRAVNLARTVSDGEQIIVPAQGETAASGSESSSVGSDGVINLNTATQADLETLPRVGPAIAQRILDWRQENGSFRAVDDLMAVPGIGDKMLAGIRNKVRV